MQNFDLSNCYKLLSKSNDIEELISPLNQYLKINYFNYVRILNGGKRTLLSNKPEYIQNFYETFKYNEKNIIDIESHCKDTFFTWDMCQNQKTFIDAKNYYNIANGITLIKPQEDYLDLYYFGTTKDNYNACELYASSIHMFERFILYFINRASELIDFSENHYFCLESKNHINNSYNMISVILDEISKDKNFKLSNLIEKTHIELTHKESLCAIYILLQMSGLEISKVMGLSQRTIEYHINNMKNKLCCFSKNQLMKTIKQMVENCEYLNSTSIKDIYKDKSFIIDSEFLALTKVDRLFLGRDKRLFLTIKEAMCLYFMSQGLMSKEIAREMDISYRTVEKNIENIYKKLNLSKKSSLIDFCLRTGIIKSILHACEEIYRPNFLTVINR